MRSRTRAGRGDRKRFAKSAKRVNRRNIPRTQMRGGYRL